jgi:hypothetical protein
VGEFLHIDRLVVHLSDVDLRAVRDGDLECLRAAVLRTLDAGQALPGIRLTAGVQLVEPPSPMG